LCSFMTAINIIAQDLDEVKRFYKEI